MTRMWGEYHKVIPAAYLTPRLVCKLLDFSKLLPRQFVWIQNFKWNKMQLWEGHLEAIKWHPGMLSVLVEGWRGRAWKVMSLTTEFEGDLGWNSWYGNVLTIAHPFARVYIAHIQGKHWHSTNGLLSRKMCNTIILKVF